MTFQELFTSFQVKHPNHDVVFFEIVFCLSKKVKTKEDFIANRNQIFDFSFRKFNKMCNDYFVREKPLAHITGHTTFCNLDFKVDKKVLCPREVTEKMTWDFIHKHQNDERSEVIDLCCGCGCIGISIKKHIPQFIVFCIDKYWGPITNTYSNAVKYKIPLIVHHKDAIKFLNWKGHTDYIISNPPYIDANNFENTNMFKWESKKALLAENNGLYFYQKYFDWLEKHTFKEAWLEIGYDQLDKLKAKMDNWPSLAIEVPTNYPYIIVKRKA